MRRNVLIGAAFVAVLALLSAAQLFLENEALAQSQGAATAPRFEVDPFWPKPLPNKWLLGNTIGVFIDAKDTVWIVHRGVANLDNNERGLELKISDCCQAAPPVLAFDKGGNVVKSWGGPGPGYDWPESNHGIFIDHLGNVWIGGNGAGDSHIMKFTQDGKFIAQYGKPNARMAGKNEKGQPIFKRDSKDPNNFGRVAKIYVDAKDNEAYIADGYFNRRVAVLDAASGKMKRFWGAYGKPPDDADLPPYDPAAPLRQTFGNPVHCADMSVDRLVYVCDRINDRIQVFRPDGTFVNEVLFAKTTKGSGSAWDVAFSRDPQQRFMYVADGQNNRVYVVERASLKILTSFGTGGRMTGQFFGVHSIAVDSQGNIYTTETYEGKRVQKFVYKGMAPVTQEHQLTVWPRTQ